jgi:hypothetical protein
MSNIAFSGLCCPMPPHSGGLPNFAENQLNTTNTKVAAIFVVPKTGTIDFCGFNIFQTQSGTVKVSFQDVDTSTGFPDGIVDQFNNVNIHTWGSAVMTHNGLPSGTKRSVTRGQILAIVWEYVDSNQSVRSLTSSSTLSLTGNFPYMAALTGGSWTKLERYPVISIHYTDGSVEHINGAWPINSTSTFSFNQTSSPDERGMVFQLPVSMAVSGFWFYSSFAAGSSADIKLYDSNNNVLTSLSLDTDITTSNQIHRGIFPTSQTLDANTNYRLVFKPTTDTNLSFTNFNVATASLMNAVPGGRTWQATSRTDNGSWTDVPTSRPWMGLFFDSVAETNHRPLVEMLGTSSVTAEAEATHVVESDVACSSSFVIVIGHEAIANLSVTSALTAEVRANYGAVATLSGIATVQANVKSVILNASLAAVTTLSSEVEAGEDIEANASVVCVSSITADAIRTAIVESTPSSSTSFTAEVFVSFSGAATIAALTTLSSELAGVHSAESSITSVASTTSEVDVDHISESDIAALTTLTATELVSHPIESNIECVSTTTATETVVHFIDATLESSVTVTADAVKLHIVSTSVIAVTTKSAIISAEYSLNHESESEAVVTCQTQLAKGLQTTIVTQSTTSSEVEVPYVVNTTLRCGSEFAVSSTADYLPTSSVIVETAFVVVHKITKPVFATLPSETLFTGDGFNTKNATTQIATGTTVTAEANVDVSVSASLLVSDVFVAAKIADLAPMTVLSTVIANGSMTYKPVVIITTNSSTETEGTSGYNAISVMRTRSTLTVRATVDHIATATVAGVTSITIANTIVTHRLFATKLVETAVTCQVAAVGRGVVSSMTSDTALTAIAEDESQIHSTLSTRTVVTTAATRVQQPSSLIAVETIFMSDATRVKNLTAEMSCVTTGTFTYLPLLGQTNIVTQTTLSADAKSSYFVESGALATTTVGIDFEVVKEITASMSAQSTFVDGFVMTANMNSETDVSVNELVEHILEATLTAETSLLVAHSAIAFVSSQVSLIAPNAVVNYNSVKSPMSSDIAVAATAKNNYFCQSSVRFRSTMVFGTHPGHWLDEMWLEEELNLTVLNAELDHHWQEHHWIEDEILAPLVFYSPDIVFGTRASFKITGDIVETCLSNFKCIDKKRGITKCVTAKRVKSAFNKFESDKVTDALAPVNSICRLAIDEEIQKTPKRLRTILHQNVLGALRVIPTGPNNATCAPKDVVRKPVPRRKTPQMAELEMVKEETEKREYCDKKWSNLSTLAQSKRLDKSRS